MVKQEIYKIYKFSEPQLQMVFLFMLIMNVIKKVALVKNIFYNQFIMKKLN